MGDDRRDEQTFSWLTKGNEWTDGDGKSGVSYAVDFWDASVEQMELTGTGFEEVVFEAVYNYLAFISREPGGVRNTLHDASEENRAVMALAGEIAANANFTEYGCSMRTAWVDEPGIAWMRDYEAWRALPESQR